MERNTLVFIQQFGPVIGQYPIPVGCDPGELAEHRRRMDLRWKLANDNPECIAAFWYVDGELSRFQFNRA